MQKKADLVFFSWTGNTRKVFKFLASELEKVGVAVTVHEIKPKRDLPYVLWLLLSFIPGLSVDINPVRISSKVLFLGMPKWTFNCPPVTAFLNRTDLTGKLIFLIVTYGGFDEERYAKNVAEKIKRKGGVLRKILLVRRKKIECGGYEETFREFLQETGIL